MEYCCSPVTQTCTFPAKNEKKRKGTRTGRGRSCLVVDEDASTAVAGGVVRLEPPDIQDVPNTRRSGSVDSTAVFADQDREAYVRQLSGLAGQLPLLITRRERQRCVDGTGPCY